jgi:DNA-directed RNA polymerase specialized sigma24 family protein
MSAEHSVTRWLGPLKEGQEAAVQAVWERFFDRLVRLARKKLRGASRGVADAEDAAMSAFGSFCDAARAGRFPRLFDRDDLWHLLVVITTRKTANLARRESAKKRGGGQGHADVDLTEVITAEPDPAFAAEAAEQFRHLLEVLKTNELRRVAILKMEGYTNREVADRLGCVVGTVERKLRVIRTAWERELRRE